MSLVEHVHRYDRIPLFPAQLFMCIQKIPFGVWDWNLCVLSQCSVPHRHPVGLIEKSVRPPKNRAVIYGLKVPAVYTTPLQFNSCYHGVTPQHYITGATAAPATSRCKWDHHQSQLGLSWYSSYVLIAP